MFYALLKRWFEAVSLWAMLPLRMWVRDRVFLYMSYLIYSLRYEVKQLHLLLILLLRNVKREHRLTFIRYKWGYVHLGQGQYKRPT